MYKDSWPLSKRRQCRKSGAPGGKRRQVSKDSRKRRRTERPLRGEQRAGEEFEPVRIGAYISPAVGEAPLWGKAGAQSNNDGRCHPRATQGRKQEQTSRA